MKFGPIVGDTKTFNKPEMSKYREMNSEHPSLLLGHDTILDVSNESKFVQKSAKMASLKTSMIFCFPNALVSFHL